MPKARLAIALLVVLVTSVYLHRTSDISLQNLISSLLSAGSKLAMAESNVLSNLTISLRQISSDPITLAVTVKNNNASPVTILTWDSPLDPLALQLGTLAITPDGSSSPLDIPIIKVSRKLPPGEDSLVELDAGQTSRENVVVLKEMVVGKQLRETNTEKVSVKCKGQWRAVWATSRKDLDAESIQGMGTDERALPGEFESEAFDVVVK